MHNQAYLQSATICSSGSMIQILTDMICKAPVEYISKIDVLNLSSFQILAMQKYEVNENFSYIWVNDKINGKKYKDEWQP